MTLLFKRVSNIDKVLFTKHLSVMIRSGIIITEAIDTLIPETKSPYFHSILQSVLTDLENGQPLSKALSRFPDVFDRLYLNLVKVGEESGTLDENLMYLADKLRKDHLLRKKIQGVMMYPSIVMAAALLVGGYITFFVLPQLLDFFDTLNVPLPLTTKILLGFAQIMQQYGILIIALFFVGFWGFKILVRTRRVRPYWHQVLLQLPVYGPFIRNVQLAGLFRNLGIMLQSGLTILTALQIEKDAADNEIFREYIGSVANGVSRGKNMAKLLASTSYRHVPPLAIKMIAVGEKTGKLDESLSYLGEFFEDEIDSTAKNISAMIEPAIVIVIGLIVMFLAFSIVSPIYQLTGSIHR